MHGRWTLVNNVGTNSAEGYTPWVLSQLWCLIEICYYAMFDVQEVFFNYECSLISYTGMCLSMKAHSHRIATLNRFWEGREGGMLIFQHIINCRVLVCPDHAYLWACESY